MASIGAVANGENGASVRAKLNAAIAEANKVDAKQDASELGDAAFADILGIVSQSGGVPTGAIIERGSNANGEYVKFADGFMFCTHEAVSQDCTTADGGVFRSSAAGSWTYPASFAEPPFVGGAVSGTTIRWVTCNAASTLAAFRQFSGQSSSTVLATRLFAVGRWY